MHYSKENSCFVALNLPNSKELFFFPVVYSILTSKSRTSLMCYTFKAYFQFNSLPLLYCFYIIPIHSHQMMAMPLIQAVLPPP